MLPRAASALRLFPFSTRYDRDRQAVRPPLASGLPPLLSSGDTGLERLILGSPSLVEDQPAEESRTSACCGTEAGVPADGAGDCPDAGAAHCAGKRALLGRGHIGAT